MLLRQLSSFYGPVLKQLDAQRQSHFLTLTHWIEARKFDIGLYSQIVEDLLLMPGEHDARKFARQNTASWRSDWQLIRANVIRLGVAYFCLARLGNKPNVKALVAEIVRGGISEAVALELCSQGVQLAQGPKVCILAGGGVPLIALNRRMRLINKRFEGTWILVHWRGRSTNEAVHEWAINAGLPVLYAGQEDQRTSGPAAHELGVAADFYWIFDQKKDKKADRTVYQLRQAGKTVEIDFWQDEGTGQLF